MDKLIGKNKSLDKQIDILENILLKNKTLMEVLKRLEKSNLKNYYVGAGAVNQTVFNYYHEYEIDNGIEDFDIVYYDEEDISYEAEDKVIKYVQDLLLDLNISTDIKNQARVHIWYNEKYDIKIDQLKNLEHAISTWKITFTGIGVRLENNKLIVCAPFGLNDLFSMIIRPTYIEGSTKSFYESKIAKWKSKWPMLEVIPWRE